MVCVCVCVLYVSFELRGTSRGNLRPTFLFVQYRPAEFAFGEDNLDSHDIAQGAFSERSSVTSILTESEQEQGPLLSYRAGNEVKGSAH
eukprot:9483472-Pyramimonas_sp.AAC.1